MICIYTRTTTIGDNSHSLSELFNLEGWIWIIEQATDLAVATPFSGAAMSLVGSDASTTYTPPSNMAATAFCLIL